MKTTHTILLAAAVCFSALSATAAYDFNLQTTAGAFSNPVLDVDGTTRVDNSFSAQIAVNGTLVGTVAQFGMNGSTVVSGLNGFLSAGTFTVPSGSLFGGSSATVQLFAWKGAANYTTALVTGGAKVGNSVVINNVVLGGQSQDTLNTFTVPSLLAMPGFTMSTVAAVPEPATLALGLFGAAGMLFRRRK